MGFGYLLKLNLFDSHFCGWIFSELELPYLLFTNCISMETLFKGNPLMLKNDIFLDFHSGNPFDSNSVFADFFDKMTKRKSQTKANIYKSHWILHGMPFSV